MSNPKVKRAIEIVKEQRYYDSIQGLMSWDIWEGLSKEGQPYRSEVSGYFTQHALNLLKSKETEKLVRRLEREIEKQEAVIARYDIDIEAAAADYQELTRLLAEKEKAEELLMEMMEQWEAAQENL